MKRRTMAMAVGSLCLGLAMANATPALAGSSTGWIRTTDSVPGGEAKFTADGDKLTVCDVESDGWAVRAWLRDYYSDYGYLQDGGDDGVCVTKSYSQMAEGRTVYILICLHKADKGDMYCVERTAGKS